MSADVRAPLLAITVSAAIAAACSSSDSLVVVSPEADVEWQAVLVEDEDGILLASTGISPVDPGSAVRLDLSAPAPDAHTVRLVGFTDAQLASVVMPQAPVLASSLLRHAGPQDALLPTPAFAAEGTIDGDVVVLKSATTSPSLTVGWLSPCPQPVDPNEGAIVDISCGLLYCDASFVQRGCQFGVDIGHCGRGELTGSLDGRGVATYEPFDLGGQCEHRARPGDQTLAAECAGGMAGSCRVDVYARPLPQRFEVESLAIFDVRSKDGGHGGLPLPGYLGDVVVLPEYVVVTTFAGSWLGRREPGAPHTPAPRPGTVVFIHPDELRIVGTATVPPLLRYIVRDPAGDGFLGLFGEEPTLGRFDAQGQLRRAVPLDPSLVDWTSRPTGIEVVGTPPRLVVGIRADTATTSRTVSRVLTFDATTLDPRVATPELVSVDAIGAAPRDRFFVMDDLQHLFLFYDVHSGVELDTVYVPSIRGNIEFGRGIVRDDQLLVSAWYRDGGIFGLRLPAGSSSVHTVFFEFAGDPLAMTPWPADPRLLLVSVSRRGVSPRRAAIGLFDPEVPRFVAGTTLLGEGVVGDTAHDALGRVWVTLPWSATIARVSAR